MMMVRAQPGPRRYPATTLLVSLCVGMGGLSLLTGCVREPQYVAYRARLLPANAPEQPPQDERTLKTPEDMAAPHNQALPWEEPPDVQSEALRWGRVPPSFWAVPPIGFQAPGVEHGQPADYERAIDAQVQRYRQQRSLQEQEQVRREQRWEEERRNWSDPRLER